MIAEMVDPRDTRWEVEAPDYRAYFWSADGTRCWEYEVQGATDVREVLHWAEEERADRVLELWVRHDGADGPGLIRLLGERPGPPTSTP